MHKERSAIKAETIWALSKQLSPLAPAPLTLHQSFNYALFGYPDLTFLLVHDDIRGTLYYLPHVVAILPDYVSGNSEGKTDDSERYCRFCLEYTPNTVTAAPGDVVNFNFQGPHTVTQVSFDTPCQPLAGGFDSSPLDLTTGSTFSVTVNDTNPVWVACMIPKHCISGMVFAINPPTSGDHTFADFQSIAEGKSSPPNSTTTATSTGSPATMTSTTSSTAPTSTTSKSGARASINVTVGSSGLKFGPETITAATGDVINFNFNGSHTVTKVSFDTPCTALPDGFDTAPLNLTTGATFSVTVNNTDPVWIACIIPRHCVAGMVFAINPPTSGNDTFANFQAIAEGKNGSTTTTTSQTSTGSVSSAPTSTTSKSAAHPTRVVFGITGLNGAVAVALVLSAAGMALIV
ncbi:hypothetical protein DL93DRAFT_2129092 [Clavulina sp. PMI_390]|nr:hypothetical protein DL93DRAFT_2129092 [Clavulina sp. PMI_390]